MMPSMPLQSFCFKSSSRIQWWRDSDVISFNNYPVITVKQWAERKWSFEINMPNLNFAKGSASVKMAGIKCYRSRKQATAAA